MSSKSRRRSTPITLGSSRLDGYSGKVMMLSLPRRSWWRRLLRLQAKPREQLLYANVKGSTARAWRR